MRGKYLLVFSKRFCFLPAKKRPHFLCLCVYNVYASCSLSLSRFLSLVQIGFYDDNMYLVKKLGKPSHRIMWCCWFCFLLFGFLFEAYFFRVYVLKEWSSSEWCASLLSLVSFHFFFQVEIDFMASRVVWGGLFWSLLFPWKFLQFRVTSAPLVW